ncbi:ATP-binding protein [Leptolyngbya sp. PCC 6406]|uniref:ATP-binding protein n=1 Tax=Leptolyngbya sp. PCC 6406 TaxID=1173264 RepID=UPI0002AC515A|nr:ATP-binding protein [Leptolyngbya sp. PCC 6406]
MKLSSLFRKTLMGQTLLFGLVVGTLSITSAYSLRWYLAGEYSSRGSAVARSIAGASANLLETDSLEILPDLLDEFRDLQGVAYVFVTTPEGEILGHTFEQGIPEAFQRPRFKPQANRNVEGIDPKLRRFVHSPNFENTEGGVGIDYMLLPEVGYVINLSLPIQGGDLGYVYVGMDQVRMIHQIRAAASIQFRVMLGLFILSIVATYFMVRRISQPLNQLTDYAQRLANRNFSSTVSITSKDEIGLLATTMQSMAMDIQIFIGQLEDALAELQSTQTQLIQHEKMSSLGQLVAGVAHEINNPVSFIACNINYAEDYAKSLMALVAHNQTQLQLLSKDFQAEATDPDSDLDLNFVMTDFPKVLDSMRLGADRIRTIVQSLRNFSRLDESDVKAVDIHEGIDSTLMILNSRLKNPVNGAAMARGRSTTIAVEKHYGDLPKVECYAGQLNQVFMNILGNAIDALDTEPQIAPPVITICTERHGDYAHITIHDNGGGISPEAQSRLFDPFFTTKPVGKGTGLGLAISYQIVVDRHHGQLHCTSEPGTGTTFTIEIPVRQSGGGKLALVGSGGVGEWGSEGDGVMG